MPKEAKLFILKFLILYVLKQKPTVYLQSICNQLHFCNFLYLCGACWTNETWLFNYAFDYKCFKVIVNNSVSGQIQTRKLKCLKVTSAKTMINSESEEAETQFKIYFISGEIPAPFLIFIFHQLLNLWRHGKYYHTKWSRFLNIS